MNIFSDLLTGQDIHTAKLVEAWTADKDYDELQLRILLSGLAGGGTYQACATIQPGGAGTVFQSPTSTGYCAAGVSTLWLPGMAFPIQAGDILKVYVQGLPGDAAVGVAIALWNPTPADSPGVATIPANVWSYASRTLTQLIPIIPLDVDGSSISIYNSTDVDVTLEGLTDFTGWSKLWFTGKNSASDADADAIIQLVVCNPAKPTTDGLLYLQGKSQKNTDGSITIISTTSIEIKIAAEAATNLIPALTAVGVWDVKAIVSGKVVPVSEGGALYITGAVTRAIK